MPCGYCSENGHTMRNCNSDAALNLIARYVVTSRTVRSEEGMNIFLRSFTSDMLSLIMYFYGASTVSINRAAKEEYIRRKFLEGRAELVAQGQPTLPPVLIQAPPIVSQTTRQVIIIRQGNSVARVLEPMSVYKARMQIIADIIFDVICVTAYGIIDISASRIRRYINESREIFLEMLDTLSEAIMVQTNDSINESFFLTKIIIKKLCVPIDMREEILDIFDSLIVAEGSRILLNLPAHNPQAFLAQLYVPHVPKFGTIKMCNSIAKEAEDYTCGICSDDFTQKTIATLGCEHTLCGECIVGQIKARTKSRIKCPYCREEVHQISVEDTKVRSEITKLVHDEIAKNPL